MPALDDIRALRAQRERALPQSRPAADDDDDDEPDDPNVIESGALSHEDEMLAMRGTAPFGSSTPAPARYQEQSAPEASGWTTKHMQALTPMWITHSDEDAEAFCVRFSPDDTLLAAGCGDGVVRVFHTEDGRLAYKLEACTSGLPTTAIRFRPTSAASKTRNVLLAANSDGTVQHWHVTSSRCLHTITEEDNQVYALDYAVDGLRFATGGKDYTVRVYDEATKTCVGKLCGGYTKTSQGHSNRIFSVKFSPTDPNILVSAGWDNTVQVWDTRAETAILSFYGPHVCGDALDLVGNTLLTGSWRPGHQLQLWNLETGKIESELPWRPNAVLHQRGGEEPCLLYGAQFCKQVGADLVAAGGTGAGEVKIFSRGQQSVVGAMACEGGVYGVDFSNAGGMLAVAGGDNSIRICRVPRVEKLR